jgi:biopolymer transport protein ExbB/TolQ
MTPVDQLREIFHAVASGLVWPVLIGLLGLAASMLVTLGAFAREAWDRGRGQRRSLERDLAQLDDVAPSFDRDEYALQLEQVLQHTERRRWRSLNRLKLAVRVGPSLGLMGTLIPMAAALQGLAEGNLPALASNMVTAFAATVIGLTVSVIAYLVAAARENWVRADTETLAFHAERLSRRAVATPARQVG